MLGVLVILSLVETPSLLCGHKGQDGEGGRSRVEFLAPTPPHSAPLSLQPPAEDKINGILLGFRIRDRELLYEGLRGFTLRGINNPGAKWAELTCEWHPQGSGDTRAGTLPSLP